MVLNTHLALAQAADRTQAEHPCLRNPIKNATPLPKPTATTAG